MNIKFIEGNLLDSTTDIICHQVNGQGAFNSGVAKCIRDKYPSVYSAYKEYCKMLDIYEKPKLGLIHISNIGDNRFICNLFGQDKYGYDGKRYTSYDAVYDGLENLKSHMLINNLSSVSFPYQMSSVRGGAKWEIIYCMICEVFKDTNIKIEIWRLE
jgi:O-acetyl-ADP-ribose deacetylase (regulator of RNase III)